MGFESGDGSHLPLSQIVRRDIGIGFEHFNAEGFPAVFDHRVMKIGAAVVVAPGITDRFVPVGFEPLLWLHRRVTDIELAIDLVGNLVNATVGLCQIFCVLISLLSLFIFLDDLALHRLFVALGATAITCGVLEAPSLSLVRRVAYPAVYGQCGRFIPVLRFESWELDTVPVSCANLFTERFDTLLLIAAPTYRAEFRNIDTGYVAVGAGTVKISLFGSMGLWQCFENLTALVASNTDIGARIDIVFSSKGVIVLIFAVLKFRKLNKVSEAFTEGFC